MGYDMQKCKRVSLAVALYALGLGAGGSVFISGCGGSDKPEMVKPAEPVSVTAKDSMDHYRDSMPQKGKKK
jgi:hypothetical protein